MPRKRFYKLPVESREKLLRLAAKQFAERGFDSASLNEILASAGISKGSYYYYFDDKEDLFATVGESMVEELLARLPMPDLRALNRRSFWPTIEKVVATWARAMSPSLDVIKITLLITETQRRSERFAHMIERSRAIFRELIEAGREVGCIRKDLPTDELIVLLEGLDVALDRVLAGKGKLTQKKVDVHVGVAFDSFRRLLEKRD